MTDKHQIETPFKAFLAADLGTDPEHVGYVAIAIDTNRELMSAVMFTNMTDRMQLIELLQHGMNTIPDFSLKGVIRPGCPGNSDCNLFRPRTLTGRLPGRVT